MSVVIWWFLFASRFAMASSQPSVQVPEGCWARSYPCAVQSEKTMSVRIGGEEWVLGSGTQLLLLSQQEVQLVRGALWGRLSGGTTLRFGNLRFSGDGDVFFNRQLDRLLVRGLKAQVRVQGPAEYLEVPQGFENWYEGLDRKLVARSGIPRAYDLKHFVQDWISLWGPDAAQPDHKKLLGEYKSAWKKALGQEAEMYHNALESRRIAQAEEEKKRLARIDRVEAEKRHFRRLFRQRYFQPDLSVD